MFWLLGGSVFHQIIDTQTMQGCYVLTLPEEPKKAEDE